MFQINLQFKLQKVEILSYGNRVVLYTCYSCKSSLVFDLYDWYFCIFYKVKDSKILKGYGNIN